MKSIKKAKPSPPSIFKQLISNSPLTALFEDYSIWIFDETNHWRCVLKPHKKLNNNSISLIEWLDEQDVDIDFISPRDLTILISEFYDK